MKTLSFKVTEDEHELLFRGMKLSEAETISKYLKLRLFGRSVFDKKTKGIQLFVKEKSIAEFFKKFMGVEIKESDRNHCKTTRFSYRKLC